MRAAVAVVFRKELLDGLRDRRSLLSTLLLPLLWPAIIGFTFSAMASRQREAEQIELPIVAPEHAPFLVEWLDQQPGVEIAPGPEDPQEVVRTGKRPVVLVVRPDFAGEFSRARPARVDLISDGSRRAALPVVHRVRRLLGAYSRQIGGLRLMARGVSPDVVRALDVRNVEVSSARQRAGVVLGVLPMFVVMAAFIGGLNVAVDTTAGERERGSLEALLVTPVPRRAIVLGKWLAAVVFSVVCLLLTLGASVYVLNRVPLHELGLRAGLGPTQVGGLLAVALPVSLLASGLQTLVATFARSYKEAQTYLQMLILLPMIPGLIGSVYPIDSRPWMIPVPLLGQQVLFTEVLGGEPVSLVSFVVASVSALALSLVCVAYTTRLFHRERIIFGRG